MHYYIIALSANQDLLWTSQSFTSSIQTCTLTCTQTFITSMRERTKQWSPLHLGRPEAESCGLDVSLLFVHQQQRLVVCQTEILPCRHMSKSERLTPANVTATPSGHRSRQWRQHTELLQIHSKQNRDNKEKAKWKVVLVYGEIAVREIAVKWRYV